VALGGEEGAAVLAALPLGTGSTRMPSLSEALSMIRATRPGVAPDPQEHEGGHESWTSVEATSYATTEIAGLTLLTEYRFRASAMIGRTPGEWSPEVKLLVH
jgi:hypothetical protein